MEKLPHTLKPGQRVRLKDGYDDLYAWARVGAEGVVKEVNYDSAGWPFALIEWDEDHWTYEGEEDGWQPEAHFEPVEEPKMSEVDPDTVAQITAQVLAAMKQQEQAPDKTTPEEAKATPPAQDEAAARYAAAVDYAKGELDEGEAFMLIVVKKLDHEGTTVLAPEVVSMAHNQTGVVAVEAQLAALAAASHSRLVEEKLYNLSDEDTSK